VGLKPIIVNGNLQRVIGSNRTIVGLKQCRYRVIGETGLRSNRTIVGLKPWIGDSPIALSGGSNRTIVGLKL